MAEADRAVLAALAAGRIPARIGDDCEFADELRSLATLLGDVQRLALALGRGDLALPLDLATKGPVIGSLKALNSSLRHLTWQAQRVADGDLSHRVDFMGEFSEAFNDMVRQLAQREALEAELSLSQKLTAIGQLAGGVAHEINTPAQFVGDNIRFVTDALRTLGGVLEAYREAAAALSGDPRFAALARRIAQVEAEADLEFVLDETPRACASALDGVARVASIVGALKEFANPEQHDFDLADINRALEATLTVAQGRIREVAEVRRDFGELPQVVCLVGELNQVFLGLIQNATDALADQVAATGRKGTIGVRTCVEDGFAVVEIADDGPGMPPDVQARVFEPFFTTKGVGRGAGQGLPAARTTIVDKHHGSLTFESRVGAGTRFVIKLPLARV